MKLHHIVSLSSFYFIVFYSASARLAEGDVIITGKTLETRNSTSLALLTTGEVIAIGGGNGVPELIFAKVYTDTGGTDIRYVSSALLQTKEVLIPAEESVGNSIHKPLLYSPVTNIWRPTGAPVEGLIGGRSLRTMKDGRVLAFCGSGYEGNELHRYVDATSTVEIYNPKSDEWSVAGSKTVANLRCKSVLLDTGKIMVFGEVIDNHGYYIKSDIWEIYDPATDKWSRTGSMVHERFSILPPVILPSGKVAVIGRWSSEPEESNVEIYNPSSETWDEVLTFKGGQDLGSNPVLLPSGKVILMYSPGYGNLYDPVSNTITVIENNVGDMVCGPVDFSSVLKPSGNVLMVGGYYRVSDKCICPESLCIDLKYIYEYEGGTPSWCKVCPGDGTCTIMDEGLPCDDGDPATTTDHCDGKGNCVSTPWPLDGGTDLGPDTGDAEIDGGGVDTGSADVPGAESPVDAASHDAGQLDGSMIQDTDVEIAVYAPGCGCAQVGLQ